MKKSISLFFAACCALAMISCQKDNGSDGGSLKEEENNGGGNENVVSSLKGSEYVVITLDEYTAITIQSHLRGFLVSSLPEGRPMTLSSSSCISSILLIIVRIDYSLHIRLQLDKHLAGRCKVVFAAGTIRQNKLLLSNVNKVYIVDIYYQASSETKKVSAVISELVSYQILNLTKLKRNQPLLSVKRDHIGIITV